MHVPLIDPERRLEIAARVPLVAGAHQLRAEIRDRAEVLAIERDRLARVLDGFVKPVVMRGDHADDAMDLAVGGMDLQRLGHRLVDMSRCPPST